MWGMFSVYTVFYCYANLGHRQDPEEAARDFRDRIRNYEKVYQTIDESEKHLTYVKIINIGYE